MVLQSIFKIKALVYDKKNLVFAKATGFNQEINL